ncbi:glycosyltransferase family 39 protein [Leptolyngbya sp. FACHB-17]|uniref:glycosyltransferase family 39 protein n=1 Tax=unclassified Leptolyngbya TaxID=2650499 RepID=UPI00167FFCCA|nr:glycosyltransferase family 39 protein [Leptolyngbya sp. FACHB-17]MBD2082809.1 glycosyltransferase family 39 protein [Leptolyngbya sp. FACHB-17]
MLTRNALRYGRKALTLEMLLGSAIVIGICFRILNLGTREFWYDEVLSLLLSTGQRLQYSLPDDTPIALARFTALLSLPPDNSLGAIAKTLQGLVRGLYKGEPHPPVFFFAQHLWLRLFGNSEIAMRSLPVLWSLGAIAAAYGLGRKLLDHRSGLLFAALLATNPFYLFHSLNVRMYTPLVLWAILSVWALLELISRPRWKWQVGFIASIALGLLTFYLFAYWVVVLAALALVLDRKHWLQHGIRMTVAGLLTLPWVISGTLKQLRNADLDRFGVRDGNPALLHLQDLCQTIGAHLIVGDWATTLSVQPTLISGLIAAVVLGLATIYLWKARQKLSLTIGLGMSLFPLLLAFCVDMTTQKYTLGFGWGRALIFVLPGCLLLMTIAIRQLKAQQGIAALLVLLLYLGIDAGDLTLRPRSVFHQVAEMVQLDSAPTLIAMDSQAWGHVNRLAYYIPPTSPVDLLAQPASQLSTSLKATLKNSDYRRVIWLESGDPVWSSPATVQERQQIQQVLEERFSLSQTRSLTGTMSLDQFELKLYQTAR